MKILMITTSYPLDEAGSAAPFIASIADGIAALGQEVKVIVPFHPDLRAGKRRDVELISYHYPGDSDHPAWGYAQSLEADVKLKNNVYWLAPLAMHNAYTRSIEIAGDWKPDLIHAHWVLPNGFVGARLAGKTGKPLVISLHGSDMYLARKNSIFKMFARYSLRRAVAVTACSPDLQEQAEAISRRSVKVLEYGVDVNHFAPAADSERRQHSIFSVGRLVHKKGFFQLLDAFAEIKKHYDDSTLCIAGNGPLKGSLESRAHDLKIQDSVRFAGNLNRYELPDAFRAADVVAVPSITDEAGNRDGLPNVLLEALSSGCAVVASDIPGIRNVMQDRSDGILVRSDDVPALAQAILALFREPALAEKLRANARQKAVAELSWQVRSLQLENIYAEVLGMK